MGKHLGVAYNLRLPQELKEKIAESAKELNRSMNADIVARLEGSFSVDSLRITLFDNLEEPAASIEIGPITIGLFQSKFKEIELYEMSLNSWILSYHAVRCYLRDADAQKLLELGCQYKGSSIHPYDKKAL